MNDLIILFLCIVENKVILDGLELYLHRNSLFLKYIMIFFMSIFSYCINTAANPFALIFVFLVLFIYSLKNYDGSAKKKFIFTFVVFFGNIFFSILITALLNKKIVFFIQNNMIIYTIFIITQKTIYFIVLSKCNFHNKKIVYSKEIIYLAVFSCFSILYIFYEYNKDYFNIHHFRYFLLMMLVLLAYTLFVVTNHLNKEHSIIINDDINLAKEYYKLQHEVKNKSILIRKFLESKNYKEAINVLNGLQQSNVIITQEKSINSGKDPFKNLKNKLCKNGIEYYIFAVNVEIENQFVNNIKYIIDNITSLLLCTKFVKLVVQFNQNKNNYEIVLTGYEIKKINKIKFKIKLYKLNNIIKKQNGLLKIQMNSNSFVIKVYISNKQ